MTRRNQQFGYRRRTVIASIRVLMCILWAAPVVTEAAEYIYWADHGNAVISRANLDGTGKEDILTAPANGLVKPVGLALDAAGDYIYWTDFITKQVRRANVDGTGTQVLVTDTETIWSLTLDLTDNKIYWTKQGGNVNFRGIRSSNLDGTGVQDVVVGGGLTGPFGPALDLNNNHMYYLDDVNSKIHRSNLDGTGAITILTGAGGVGDPTAIALDINNSHIYWGDSDNKAIHRCNLDGTGKQDLVTSLGSGIHGVALDLTNNYIFWTHNDGGWRVTRSNLDGTGKQDLVTGLGDLGEIVVVTSTSGGQAQEIRYVPLASKYVLMALLAALGAWLLILKR